MQTASFTKQIIQCYLDHITVTIVPCFPVLRGVSHTAWNLAPKIELNGDICLLLDKVTRSCFLYSQKKLRLIYFPNSGEFTRVCCLIVLYINIIATWLRKVNYVAISLKSEGINYLKASSLRMWWKNNSFKNVKNSGTYVY